MLESVSKANKIQRVILAATIFSVLSASILTWYGVILRGIATESSKWTAVFISHFGASGLVISFLVYFGTFFLCWLGWVRLSKERRLGKLHNGILHVSVAFAMILFVMAVFDITNNLLVVGFGSNVLLPFLKPPLLIVPILIAFPLAVIQIYFKPRSHPRKHGRR